MLFDELKCFTGLEWLGDNASYGLAAFSGCSNLTKITMPHGLKGIGYQNFQGCSKINPIIPNTVTTLSREAFKSASLYRNIVIPDSVKTIGISAFENIVITKITIGIGVTNIGSKAFNRWNSAARTWYIIMKRDTPPTIASTIFYDNSEKQIPTAIYVPDASVDSYKTSWSAYAGIIKPVSEYTGEIPATDY